ncbi:LacI family transcriptional regulator [Nonomuraea sp. NBC_01738]|uniref:LacI family DNA-binding transcriptional regulator n=1 Tax=Nonomuraea sp. NBC_01738 TaxID=2976003 RepID=UPI002E12AD46|nr:LacI family transcriptional regulator [Nonomuraea sp. NBC_01738]
MSATIYDVAQRAGVGIATVSRALRGSGSVRTETRERVLRAAEELNFTPSRLGVSLAEGRHAANGVVFPTLSGPYYAEVLLGYEEVASELGRSVIILSTQGRSAVPELVRDLAGRVDGLVVFGRTAPSGLVAELVATGKPTVLLTRTPVAGADVVTSENATSARLLAEHLLGHGHRRFAFLGGPSGGADVDERWSGVVAALSAAGVPAPQGVALEAYNVESGHRAGLRVLDGASRPDVLVCAQDEVALGVLRAARELGLDVPRDVAVTGWDDIMAAGHAWPPLTTVRQPMRSLGAGAARALDELITGARTEPRTLILPTELVIRASCGCD